MTTNNAFTHRYGRFIRATFFILILAAGLLALVLSAAGQEGSGSAVDAGRAGGEPVTGGPAAPSAGSNIWGNPLPEQINYQGQLVDNSGLPQTGVYTLTFNVLSGPPGYALLYSESQTVTTDADGLFDVMIGSVQPGLRNALDGGDAWLEVELNGELLAPRQPVSSVAYALYAQHLAGGTGPDSVIAGGRSNNASGNESVVGGGLANAAASAQATVSGGWTNSASGTLATIGGGSFNTADATGAVVGGGNQNTVTGTLAVVGGGFANYAGGSYATAGGGRNNDVYGDYATVGGGQGNDLPPGANWATIGGGYANSIAGYEVYGIPIRPKYSTIGGGAENSVIGEAATIGGGANNSALLNWASISGGRYNKAGEYGAVAGGYSNTAAYLGSVGGGTANLATGWYSVIAGGSTNSAAGSLAAISGGASNVANGQRSMVPGGTSNEANGDNSFAAGANAHANHEGAFVWSGTPQFSSPFSSTADHQFLVDAPGGVGIGTNAPQSQLHVLDTITGTATSIGAHVVTVENDSASTPDMLALNASNATNPGSGTNYVTFFDASGAIAAIEGNGGGGVAYNTSGADFAEYLPLHAGVEHEPESGTVLGLVGDALHVETAAAQRVLVVSTAPGFVGNAPDDAEIDGMALVAFMGQVPVRVRGPVHAGDLLVASGLNDSTAIAITPAQLTSTLGNQIVGQALESNSGPGVALVNTLVGQPNDAFWAARLAASEAYWSTRLVETEAQLADLAVRLKALEAASGTETGAANE